MGLGRQPIDNNIRIAALWGQATFAGPCPVFSRMWAIMQLQTAGVPADQIAQLRTNAAALPESGPSTAYFQSRTTTPIIPAHQPLLGT